MSFNSKGNWYEAWVGLDLLKSGASQGLQNGGNKNLLESFWRTISCKKVRYHNILWGQTKHTQMRDLSFSFTVFSSSLFGPKIWSLFSPSSVVRPCFEHFSCSNTSSTGIRSYTRSCKKEKIRTYDVRWIQILSRFLVENYKLVLEKKEVWGAFMAQLACWVGAWMTTSSEEIASYNTKLHFTKSWIHSKIRYFLISYWHIWQWMWSSLLSSPCPNYVGSAVWIPFLHSRPNPCIDCTYSYLI